MKKAMAILGVAMVAVVAMAIATMVGLSSSVGDLANEMEQNQVDAILASADVKDESTVSVPVVYYKQTKDECVNLYSEDAATRQFEWSECGYYKRALEKELTEPTLNAEALPVGKGGNLLSNRGMASAGFLRWFHTVEGKSEVKAANLNFKYDAESASFGYESENFEPVGKRQLFTMNLGVPVNVMGGEKFVISADDDTWVYINDKIVLDMGGIHGAMEGKFEINENGEVYTAVGDESLAYAGVKLDLDTQAVVRVFHANRDSAESVFNIKLTNMLVNVTDAVLANDDANAAGAVVAYNPDDPTYVPPLGESLTVRPDKSRMMLTSVVAQAAAMVALAVVVAMVVTVAWRQARREK